MLPEPVDSDIEDSAGTFVLPELSLPPKLLEELCVRNALERSRDGDTVESDELVDVLI